MIKGDDDLIGKIKNRIFNIKKWFDFKENVIDSLVISAFFIITVTTMILNVFVGLYLLSFILLLLAFVIAKTK